jgi:hypothetical protein
MDRAEADGDAILASECAVLMVSAAFARYSVFCDDEAKLASDVTRTLLFPDG